MEKRLVEFRRDYPLTELRADGEDESRSVSGYAAVFNSLSVPIMGMFTEKIKRGAFKKTLQEADIRSLWNHDTSKPLGRTGNDTLTLKEDRHGLRFDLDLPDTTWGRDAHESIKRQDVTGMSFRFEVIEDSWKRNKDGSEERTIIEASLSEVSPVTFPAYEATEVEARSVVEKRTIDIDELEQQEAHEDTTSPPDPEVEGNHDEAGLIERNVVLARWQYRERAIRLALTGGV